MSDYQQMTAEEYGVYYARFQGKEPGKIILDSKVNVRDRVVLDLCAGPGYVGAVAAGMGASQVYAADVVDFLDKRTRSVFVERSPLKLKWEYVDPDQALFYRHINNLPIDRSLERTFEVIFCRQAINYWFAKDRMQALARCMREDGVFVFNTFVTAPPASPLVKSYAIGERDYVEVAYTENGLVHHVQAVSGMKPHITSFRYIPLAEFESVLPSVFEDVTCILDERGSSATYICEGVKE